MNLLAIVHLIPLLILLVWAAIVDVRTRKIRNWLTLTVVLTGFGQSFLPLHAASPIGSILGLLSGFGLTIVLYALRGIGAGDVKLMAGIGAWLGPAGVTAVFAIQAIIGLLYILTQAVRQRRLGALFHNSMMLAVNVAHIQEVGLDHVSRTGQATRTIDRPLPFAAPVLAAVVLLVIRSYILGPR